MMIREERKVLSKIKPPLYTTSYVKYDLCLYGDSLSLENVRLRSIFAFVLENKNKFNELK